MKAKKLLIPLLLLLMILGFAIYKDKMKPDVQNTIITDESKKSVSNSYESSEGDIFSLESFYEDGEFLYYMDSKSPYNLYMQKKDGKESVLLSSNVMAGFIIKEDWIYYINAADNNRLYRMQTDGSRNEVLSEDGTWYFSMSKEYIYYNCNTPEKKGICRITLDGKDKLQLCNDVVNKFIVAPGDWIYYENQSDQLCTYRIGMDGKEQSKVTNKYMGINAVDKDWIYYIGYSTNNLCWQVNRIKHDGSQDSIVAEIERGNSVFDIKSQDGYLYLELGDETLWRLKKDGKELIKLSQKDEYVKTYYLSNKGIYYARNLYYPNYYKINLSGGKETALNNFAPGEVEVLGNLIVYSDSANNFYLTVMNKETGASKVLYNGKASSIKVYNNMIFFLNDSDGEKNLYSIKSDGSVLNLISVENVANYTIDGEFVYYYSIKNSTLQMAHKSGKGKLVLSRLVAKKIAVYGDWVYFSEGDSVIYRVKKDGSGAQEFIKGYDGYSNDFVISGKYLYYAKSECFAAINLSNLKEETPLYNDYPTGEFLEIRNDVLYQRAIVSEGVTKYSNTYAIYGFNLKTSKHLMIIEGIILGCDIAGDELYFNRVDVESSWIKIDFDGKGHELVRDLKQ